MNIALTFLLTLVSQYGYPIIMVIILFVAFGLPLPITSILLAAGSITVDGTLNIYLLIFLVSFSAISGDLIGYWFGRKFGKQIVNQYMRGIGVSEQKIQQLDVFLNKWGAWCIFLSRWLLTPLGVPLNIVAGFRKYTFSRFLCLIVIGEILWAGMYIYIGYLLGANWVMLADYISNTPLIILLLIIGLTSLGIAYKLFTKKK